MMNIVDRISEFFNPSVQTPPMPKGMVKRQVGTLSTSKPKPWKMPDMKKFRENLKTGTKSILKFLTAGVIFNQVMQGLNPNFAIRFEFFSKFFDGVFILWISCFNYCLKIIPSLANGTFIDMNIEFYTKMWILICKGMAWIANFPI